MRVIQSLILFSIIGLVVIYVVEQNETEKEESVENISKTVKEKTSMLETKTIPENKVRKDLIGWIGKSSDQLLDELGEPERKDPTAYDYDWWIYKESEQKYVQFGVLNQEVVTLYATGDNINIEPFYIGQNYDEVLNEHVLEDEINYSEGVSSYSFRLTGEDLQVRPLVQVEEQVFLQLYFDTFTNELSSIRVLTGDTLLKHRPYEIVYRGDLPDEPQLSKNQWETVEAGMEQQIFDITNIIRTRHGKEPLQWEQVVREVAYNHSKDMAENNYFSHFSLDGDGLKERLATKEVFYVSAGENIAAQYTDAPAAMEGWLNSEGHREALLNEEYTHIGVGVYRLYYTQNFLAEAL